MKITINHYGKKIQWENEYGTNGRETPIGRMDETTMDELVEVIAAMLIAAGWQSQTIKDSFYDYGRTEISEEV